MTSRLALCMTAAVLTFCLLPSAASAQEIVVPDGIEFWYAGDSRLHERWLYEADDEAGWSKRMLYP